MDTLKTQTLPIRSEGDVVTARQRVRFLSVELGFSMVDQTKIVTAASELARNTLIYGGGGDMHCQLISESGRRGLRLVFEDHGPGIADIEQALKDGFTSGNGLGLGLGGARRLVNDFHIDSRVGEGTRITVVRWK